MTNVDFSHMAVKAPPSPSKWDIPLSGRVAAENSLVAFVSDEDKDLLEFKWHAREEGKSHQFYAARRRPRPHKSTEFILMHRLIAERMGILTKERPEVDHIDGNGLNNCRDNIRAASRSENAHNRNARGYTIDIYRTKKPFLVKVAGKHIGRYATEEEAVAAYRKAKDAIH